MSHVTLDVIASKLSAMVSSPQTGMGPMRRPTFATIAQESGVSVTTVERVLNGRGGVNLDKTERVISAALRLGWDRRLPELHRGMIRIEFIIARPETTFFARLVDEFDKIAQSLDSRVALHRTVLPDDPELFARRIVGSGLQRAGLIVVGADHHLVREALAKIHATGTYIIQIVTRAFGTELDYVGIDNYSAGRTAAMYIWRMCREKGVVIALCPGNTFEAHRERIRGFSDYVDAHPSPDLQFERVMFGRDDGPYGASLLESCLKERDDIVGFYNSGGHNSLIGPVLTSHGKGRRIFFVGHEFNPWSEVALREGRMDVVLDQAPEVQARRALDMVLYRVGLTTSAVPNPPIRFTTVTAESA